MTTARATIDALREDFNLDDIEKTCAEEAEQNRKRWRPNGTG